MLLGMAARKGFGGGMGDGAYFISDGGAWVTRRTVLPAPEGLAYHSAHIVPTLRVTAIKH